MVFLQKRGKFEPACLTNGPFLLRNFAKFRISAKKEKGFVISTGALVFKILILVGLVHRAM
jgi:hypothetical protein